MELAGLGALMAMLEERKKRLAAEGLFDAARKKKLPFLPEVIGVITSPTGAVIRDIMHRLNAPLSAPRAAVAGGGAGREGGGRDRRRHRRLQRHADGSLPRPDLLIVARGGGSIEDLMAFNDEAVVRAAAASKIPLISAVGHETDTTLIDFAADMRAPTPTAAAELAVPVRGGSAGADLPISSRRCSQLFRQGASDDRKRHLAQLARVLPRAEAIVRRSAPASGSWRPSGCGQACRRNLQIHRARLAEAAALLRDRPIARPHRRMRASGWRRWAQRASARRRRAAGEGRAQRLAGAVAGAGQRFLSSRAGARLCAGAGRGRQDPPPRGATSGPAKRLHLTLPTAKRRSAAEGAGRAKPRGKKARDQAIRAVACSDANGYISA